MERITFSVTMALTGATFDYDKEGETARLLHEVATKVEHGAVSGSIRDGNGNTIGSYTFGTDGAELPAKAAAKAVKYCACCTASGCECNGANVETFPLD